MAIDQGVRSKKETRADAQSVIDLAHKQGLKIVDLKFIDLIGTWQHFSIPVQELSKGLFEDGIGFDGSSIRGFQHIHESDMLLIPDPSTAIVDPVLRVPTLSINCDVIDPITREPYSRDPREVGGDDEVHHHDVGTAGQTEIGMRFDTLVNMADKVMMYTYVVKNVCAQNGFVATFMPKPLFMDNGSGMHTHQSLWKDGVPR